MQHNPIQLKELQKSYKQLQVLKGVDFEIDTGSIFSLLGSNGAGKTTIIKILTTLLKQDSGDAFVNEKYWWKILVYFWWPPRSLRVC